VCVCVFVYCLSTYPSIHLFMHVCMYVRMHVLCMFACIYVCVYVCMYVCMHTCIIVSSHPRTYLLTYLSVSQSVSHSFIRTFDFSYLSESLFPHLLFSKIISTSFYSIYVHLSPDVCGLMPVWPQHRQPDPRHIRSSLPHSSRVEWLTVLDISVISDGAHQCVLIFCNTTVHVTVVFN
jgi:hypothetical protein